MNSTDARHGTVNGYKNLACRCDRCCAAHTAYASKKVAERRERTARDGLPSHVLHGRKSAYDNWGCRCTDCRAAKAADNLMRYSARKRSTVGNASHDLCGEWIPIMALRNSGKPCICYHPWSDDEGCTCDLPSAATSKKAG